MEQNKELSIIIPHYILDDDIFRLVKKNIKSIKKHTNYPFEIVAIDNATPNSKYSNWIRKHSDIYIRNEENRGNPGGWNDGIRISNGKYLCFMDNDVEVLKNWINPLIDILQDNKVAVAFPSSKNYRHEDDYFVKLSGFCWITTKDKIDKVGMFDEKYNPGNFEDTDWYMRAKQLGYELVCSTTGRVDHWSRATTDKVKEIKDVYKRNEKYYFEKYDSLPMLDRVI